MGSPRFFLIFLVFVGNVWCITEVEKTYYCCANPTIQFDITCQNFWNFHDKTFAHTQGETQECESPCKNIEGDKMTLDSCQPVNLIALCPVKNIAEETRTRYLSQDCQYSGKTSGGQHESGSVGFPVLSAIIGQLLNWMMH